MKGRFYFALFLIVLTFLNMPTVSEETPAENPIDTKWIWDLTDLYPSTEAWNDARKDVLDRLPGLESMKGSLDDGADAFFQVFSRISELQKEAARIYTYASLKADEDLRVSEDQERRQLASQMWTKLSEATSWLQPEILRLGVDKVHHYLETNPKLERFRHGLEDTLRNAPHTLGDEAENILAASGETLRAGYNIYGLLANSDIPWPEIELSDGTKVLLDAQGYGQYRQATHREDRKAVFDAFWSKWSEYENTMGMTLVSHLQAQVFLSKARKYESVLDREMFNENIPMTVYRRLVEEVNNALPTLHRYFKLREKMLGIDQMRYYDIYPPLVSLDKKYTIEDAMDLTLSAMETLGDEWVQRQKAAVAKRWMHVFPQRGKRSGAYMSGSAYDVHPYVLLNFNETYDSVSTFAHEWGHAMHTLYAVENQPFETADYSTFIAEIPSTTLELILEEYMIDNAESDEERLYFLGNGLESLRGTFFRQTMFAEFELAVYEAIEKGEALSGEKMTAMYGDILKRYHGHDSKVVVIDDLYAHEWMYIPHFYYNMYVYQYATSITAGTALYEKIKTDGQPAVDNFKKLLKAGGSDYPYQLLLAAGVDMAQPEPYRALVKRMNDIMDRMETILK